MYCKYCGQQLAEGAVFCHSCGRKYVEKKEKKKVEELDERKELVNVTAYWNGLGILKKACFAFVFCVVSLWAAILTVSFFVG